MIRNERYVNGVVVEAIAIDLDARTITTEVDGQVVDSRPLTDDEHAELVITANPAPDLAEAVAAKLVAQENADPQPWQQPTGAHDAYLPGAIVLHPVTGDRHLNELPTPNVWALDVHGWVNLDAPDLGDEWQPGVTYATGDEVTYDGVRYACITGHTSQVGWEPPNVPSLWQAV